MTEFVVSTEQIEDAKKMISMAGNVNWEGLQKEFLEKDWLTFGLLTLDSAAVLSSPFLPQADAARSVIKLATSLVGKLPKGGNEPIDPKKIDAAFTAAKNIDWKGLEEALKGDSPVKAKLSVANAFVKVAAPFIPITVVPVAAVLTGLMYATDKVNATTYTVPGYEWDSILGWVPVNKHKDKNTNAVDYSKYYEWDAFQGWVLKEKPKKEEIKKEEEPAYDWDMFQGWVPHKKDK